MPDLKLAVQLQSFRQPFRSALATAAKLGFKAVEIDARADVRPSQFSETGLRQLRKLLDDLDLRVCAVRFPTRRGYDVQDDLDARVEATRAAMRFARQLGTSLVVNQVGRVPPESEGPQWDLLVAVLTDLGSYATRAGAQLAAETGTEPATDLARLIHALPEGTTWVTLDPGNLIAGGFSASEATGALRGLIRHVHVNDAVRDLAQGRGREVEVGRGSVDFEVLLAALEEASYDGYFAVEREGFADSLAAVTQAAQFMRNL